MAQQAPAAPRELSDGELRSLFDDAQADLSLLTPTEQERLLALTGPQPEPAIPDPAPQSSAASRFVSNAAERLNPLTMATGVYQAVRHPLRTAGAMVRAQGEQFGKARDAFRQGRYSEAVGHGAAGALPVLGPMAADIGEQMGTGDVAGGLGAAVGSVAPLAAARPLARVTQRAAAPLRAGAERRVVQALGPTKERFKAIAERRAPEILQRGLGGSRAGLRAQATTERRNAGQAIDDLLTQEGGRTVNPQAVIDALETAKADFQTMRSVPLQHAIRSGLDKSPGARVVGQNVEIPVVHEPRAVAQLDELQRILRGLGPDARIEQLVAIRRGWDKVVADAGGYAQRAPGAIGQPLKDVSEAAAKRQATTAIRQLLDAEVPDLSALNKEFAFWKDLESVVRQTSQRTAPQGPGLTGVVREGAGAAVGAVMGGMAAGPVGAAVGSVLTGAVAKQAHAAFTSTRWRLVSARTRAKLADALSSGNAEQVSRALAEVQAVIGSGATRAPAMAGETPASRPQASTPLRYRWQ